MTKKVVDITITQLGVDAGLEPNEQVILDFEEAGDSMHVDQSGALIFEVGGTFMAYATGIWAFFVTQDE